MRRTICAVVIDRCAPAASVPGLAQQALDRAAVCDPGGPLQQRALAGRTPCSMARCSVAPAAAVHAALVARTECTASAEPAQPAENVRSGPQAVNRPATMFIVRLLLKNALRHKLRTALTMVGLVVAIRG